MQTRNTPIFAELESKRFEKNVYRLNADSLSLNDIVEDLNKNSIELY